MHCVIDLETLGVLPDTVVLTLGAAKFNPHNTAGTTNQLYFKFSVDEQLAAGRTIDQDTLDWWCRQPSEVHREAMTDDDRIGVAQGLAQLTKFLVGVDDIWCQGPVFDIVILENMFRQNQMHIPWQYWQIRDSRTLFKFLDFDPRREIRKTSESAHHNALDDAITQACAVQRCYRLIKEKT